MDDKKNKKYVIPDVEIINFTKEDIITVSNGGEDPGFIGEDWEEE